MDQFLRQIRDWPPRINGDAKHLVNTESLIHKKKATLKTLIQEGGQYPEITATKWKQNVITLPYLRMKELLSKIERQAFGSPAIQSLTPPPRSDRKYKNLDGVRNVSKINRGKFPSDKNNPLLQGLLLTYLDQDMRIPDVITKCLVPKLKDGSSSQLLLDICNALGVIWTANNVFLDVIDGVISTELNASYLSAYEFLHNSFSKTIFGWYTKTYVSKWLADCWGGNITTMIEQNLYLEIDPDEVIEDEYGNTPTLIPATIAQNKEKLLSFCKYFVSEALQALNKCPPHFYDFAAVLYHYLGSERTTVVFQFIFINFFCMCIRKS
jgi:hypothetical protein